MDRIASRICTVTATANIQSPDSTRLQALLAEHDADIRQLLTKRGATNPRLFGSVAAGTAVDDSDIDLIVDFPGKPPGAQLMDALGLSVELSEALGVRVDVLVLDYAKDNVSQSIKSQAVVAI